MSIGRSTEGRTVELALPRRLRRLASVLAVLMLLLCGGAAVGAIQDPSLGLAGWFWLAGFLVVGPLITIRLLHLAFGPPARLVVESDALWLDAPALLRHPVRWARTDVALIAIDTSAPPRRAGITGWKTSRFPVKGGPEAGTELPDRYLFERGTADLPLVAMNSGVPNLLIVFCEVQPSFWVRALAGYISRMGRAATLGDPLTGLLLEVADPVGARTALLGWPVHDGPVPHPLLLPAPPVVSA